MSCVQAFAVLILLSALTAVCAQGNRLPVAPISTYVFTEEEEQPPGTTLTSGLPRSRLEAFDPDGDPITFRIPANSINSQYFNINATSGELSFAVTLDREAVAPNNEPLQLVVEVSDGQFHGAGVTFPEIEVRISLLDINDETPMFDNLPMTITVPESMDVTSTVYTAVATDRDTGANAQVEYYLEAVNGEVCFGVSSPGPFCDMFSVGLTTGTVILDSALNFDLPAGRRTHTVSIRAQDSGAVPNSRVRDLTVAVSDVNDLNPVFTMSRYFFEVHENLTMGDRVGQVTAFDQDVGVNDDVIYSILSGNNPINGSESFAINSTTGVIYVNTTVLDRETHASYQLTIGAVEESDSARFASTQVTVTVFDINDHAPFFSQQSYSMNVSEILPVNNVAVTVTAQDRDHGTNAEFEFRLENAINASLSLPFSISHDVGSGEGRIQVARPLDFEQEESYTFFVFATELVQESPMSGVTTVTLTIINENDNTPDFLNDTYTASVPENSNPGVFVEMVAAIDDDAGLFGEVRYAILNTSAGASDFNIAMETGQVETAVRLDHETVSVYTLEIEAFDRDPNSLTRRAEQVTLTVNVINLNDNPPRFMPSEPRPQVYVTEEQPAPVTVYTFNVVDADGTLNPLVFEILEGDDRGVFAINGSNLVTTEMLDFDLDVNRTYSLYVRVNDSVHTDTLTLDVHVTDINDNTPVFDNTTFSFSVLEGEDMGAVVGRASAVDADSGTFGEVVYSLAGPGANSFSINGSTGEVVTAVVLDRESRPEVFDLTVFATDQDGNLANRRTGSSQLIITTLDRNDNSPQFEQSRYSFSIVENTDVLDPAVYVVTATDDDLGSNSEIYYDISDGNVDSVFVIDPRSGVIGRNISVFLDRERTSRYTLTVVASDGGNSPNQTPVQVSIDIEDENDVTPTFDLPQFESTVREDVDSGSIVRQLMARDGDADENGQLTYSIVSVTGPSAGANAPTGTFVIDESLGTVRTRGAFDREAFEGPYTVMVLVRDGGFPVSRNSTTTVLVFISDANDNRPVFQADQYTNSLSENLPPGQLVAMVTATDNDMPDSNNSAVEYSISRVLVGGAVSSSSTFTINATSGHVTTAVALDYEQVQSYTITVEAADRGQPQRSSNAIVLLTVLDENDQPPVFSMSDYTLQVPEDTPINTRFQLVSATDGDTPPNAIIQYTSSLASPFFIDRTSGELILSSTLDFETRTEYEFIVTATNDAGGIVFTDTSRVRVEVVDVNDRSPVFTETDYSVSVDEGNYTDSPLVLPVTLEAVDADSGALGNVTFELLLPEQDSSLWDVRTIGNGRGQLVATGYLDRESVSSYMIRVLARDGGVPAATATTVVRVTVKDVNDITPQLNRVSYTATVPENSTPGEVVARVTAEDGDSGSNGEVILELDDSTNFAIDPATGEVRTLTSFNYEDVQSFSLIISARDNAVVGQRRTATASFLVNITDVNDNRPMFEATPTVGPVLEDVSMGTVITTVKASDLDSGSNGQIVYTLTGDEGHFTVDASGAVMVAAPLDRETTDQYNITVRALDRGQPQMSDSLVLFITLQDVNDVYPEFERDSYNFVVDEELPASSTIGTVIAMDNDTPANRATFMDLVEGDVSLFRIVTRAVGDFGYYGDIISQVVLDYETRSSFTLRVRARNSGSPNLERFTNVAVSLRDLNDNRPVFSMPSYVFTVSESSPVSTPVGTLVATDNDGGLNGRVEYRFGTSVDSNILSLFSLGAETGVLTLSGTLDFEVNSTYSFIVMATDLSPNPLTSQVAVRVDVQDTNENAPEFGLPSYTGTVNENQRSGSLVLLPNPINATEQDDTSIEYSIVAGGLGRFTINPVSGLVTTLQPLDREQQDRYILTVQARDMGTTSLSSFTQVDITVGDINDERPVFQEPLQFSVREDTPPSSVVGTLVASDRDAGVNGRVTFSSPSSGPFSVQQNGDILVVDASAIDFETTPTYTIVAVATDGAAPGSQLSATATFTVSLLDVNDNDPVFSLPSYTASVIENSDVGVSVLTVVATDDDGDTPIYSILSGDSGSRFRLNPTTGLIETTLNTIDREAPNEQQFTLQVRADDQRGRESVVTVTINVMDANDHAPICDLDPFMFEVPEANANPVRLGQLSTTDLDSGLNADVAFSLVSGDFDQLFSVNAAGELFAGVGLDFETTPTYSLGVAATDQSSDASDRITTVCRVEVTVLDVNDNPPQFEDALYEATIIENATTGVVVTRVTASDLDSGLNGEFFYLFQSPIREFSVDSGSGVVTVSGVLDAETQPLYTLVLEARDRGSPTRIGQTTLVVRVLDINDNAPRFDSSFFSITIREDRAMSSDVVTLEANDPDSPGLTYSIESGNDGLYFSINPTTGLIQTARSLDRETVSVFSLQVAARDQDDNIGTTTLQVRVSDVNDEAPQFLQSSYTARVPENSPSGTQVLPVLNGSTIRIEAFDSDEPNTQNSRVLYSLVGSSADLFDIDFNTGIVTVAPGASLDAEAQATISVTVVASDSVVAPNTRSSTVELLVEVLDVNDENPEFTQPFGYAIPVSEGVTVPSVITNRVRANDPDGGPGGVVRYSLTGATPLAALAWFGIDPVSGDLSVVQPLDRERDSIITLIVTATDQGMPALMSIVTVQLTISDINDNPPRFSQDIYSTSVPEFLAVGSNTITVSATDPDVGSNAEVVYRVSPPSSRFTVNPSSGVVTSTGALDHETQDRFTLTVEACDNGSPAPLCSTAVVVIDVQDFNDEPPVFDLPLYTVDVCETALAGQELVRPVATDRDSGRNALLRYRLDGDNWSLFTIVSGSGLVTLQRDVDSLDLSVGLYQLTVVATDDGDTPLSGTTQLRLRVLNCTARQFYFASTYNYLEIEEGSSQFLTPTPVALPEIKVIGNALAASFSPDYPDNPFMSITNFIGLKGRSELAAIGLGEGDGLDREVRELYTVILAASDNSVPALTSYASITVRVLDVNDNDPMFESVFYMFSVAENTTAPLNVGTVTATDRDQGLNGAFNYSIQPPLTSAPYPFSIDPFTGAITTTTELDRESIDRYNLTVVATDGTGRSGQTMVVIMVDDVNDCDPTFTSSVYSVPVAENTPTGTRVTMVTARDCDLGSNGLIRYTIVGGNVGVFSLDAESGEIRTLTPLDYEVVTSYSLTIRAVDMGVSPRTGEAEVSIEVEDFNDCPPVFINNPMSSTIGEDQTSGSVLVTFMVSDCDSGDNGVNGTRFSIIAGNIDGLFSLSGETGVLVTTGVLDRETTPTYLLSIQAQDSAGVNSLSSVTQLSITVGDVNDNDPQFDEPIIFETLSENEDTNPVFTFTASDLDDGLNGDILYSLDDGFGVFDIEESTGAISLVTTLDREITPRYNLTVIARDRGVDPRTGNLVITVDVRDVNDNPPTILNVTSGVTMASVVEGTVVGSQVFVVAARDPDLNMNGEVSFSLEDLSPDLPFEISPTGGVISVSGELDYEEQNEYTVVVIATDNGFPQRLSSVATLTIDIVDSNDNIPEFTSDVYEGSQREGVAVGTPIVTVLARDSDQTGSVNALVEYTLVGGAVEHFTIHPDTGVLSNRIVLDRENQSVYSVTVLANNSLSHTPLTSTATVQISVSDVNDETPAFTQSLYTISLSELTPTGLPLNLTVVATDNDAPETPNSALVYSLARQTNNPFSVDPDTGEVLLLNSLDFEDTSSYDLTLVVQDKGTPTTLSSQARLLILVQDENDVMPSFEQDSYSMEVSEGEASFPHRVINLEYRDGDTLAQFRRSTFSILAVEPDSPGLFRVQTDPDSETGAVFIDMPVDYELVQSYRLTLSVENVASGVGPQCQSSSECTFSQTAILEVAIGDENDNAPVFTRDSYTGEVSSTASTGTSVLSVDAVDADAGPVTGNVRYSLQSSVTLPFRIDESAGTVLTRGLLGDIPSGSSYRLTVSATDNDGVAPSNTAVTTVRITVLDDFDRIAFDFTSSVDCVVANEQRFADYLGNITGYTIFIESYLEYATEDNSLYIIHANDGPAIVDFAQFTDRLQGKEAELFQMFSVCNLTRIISFAEAEEPYQYPPLVDTQTIVILILCLLLIVGSAILLVMALTQRYLALNNARHKLLADVFYGGSPGGGSVVENTGAGENYQLESLELTGKAVNRQNPMFVHPYDNWTGVDTSGVESVGEVASSLNRDNPLYESQEIRMEMFADVQSEDEEADDAELLAQAIADDESDEDDENAITAI